MVFSRRRLIIGGLWLVFLGMILPISLQAVNPVTDVSIFNLVFAQGCEPDFTVTIGANGFSQTHVTTTLIYTDTLIGATFQNNHAEPVTVTFPQGMFGPSNLNLDNGQGVIVCEPSPKPGNNMIITTVAGTPHRLTVNVITEAITNAVGGEIVSNPIIMMLPAVTLTLIMVSIIYTGGRIRKVQKI